MKNYIAIFRIEDENDGSPLFVQLDYDEDGNAAEDGKIFHIADPESSYLKMTPYQVVIAEKINGGSIDCAWFTVMDPDGTELKIVHKLKGDDLMDVLFDLFEVFELGAEGETLQ